MPVLQQSRRAQGLLYFTRARIPRLQTVCHGGSSHARSVRDSAYASIGTTTWAHIEMSSVRFDLLRLLSDASLHSGAALARELGATPADIQLALRELENLGLRLVRVRGRGYRLAEPYDCLDAAAVRAHLGQHARHF